MLAGEQRVGPAGDSTDEQTMEAGGNSRQLVEFFIDYHAKKQKQLEEEEAEEEKEENADPSDAAKEVHVLKGEW